MANLSIPVLILVAFGCAQVFSDEFYCAICTGKADYNKLVDGCFGKKITLAYCKNENINGCYAELKINTKSKTVEIERGCTPKFEQNLYTSVEGDVISLKKFYVENGSNCNNGNTPFSFNSLTNEQRKEYEAAVKDWKSSGCDWNRWRAEKSG
ncbi:hypothetical protein HELRODRAFT_172154 [Helobdella robusta]|uniref:Uncharacterized protein n=1 Tax=Helobdella robusta TaxID=6412 RepID=T1F528_HELRO|nr:hypothetical protein HELRODRAFT_172154 [Helobdella robusta]ESO04507.1 hypothetical protein HELRODRAFT_172154 [Helobdella robusta]